MNLAINCWCVKLFLSCEKNKYFSTVLFNKNDNIEVVKKFRKFIKKRAIEELSF